MPWFSILYWILFQLMNCVRCCILFSEWKNDIIQNIKDICCKDSTIDTSLQLNALSQQIIIYFIFLNKFKTPPFLKKKLSVNCNISFSHTAFHFFIYLLIQLKTSCTCFLAPLDWNVAKVFIVSLLQSTQPCSTSLTVWTYKRFKDTLFVMSSRSYPESQ